MTLRDLEEQFGALRAQQEKQSEELERLRQSMSEQDVRHTAETDRILAETRRLAREANKPCISNSCLC